MAFDALGRGHQLTFKPNFPLQGTIRQGNQLSYIPKEVVDASKQGCQFNATLIFSIHSLSDVTVCVTFMCSVFPFFSSHFVCSFLTLILYFPLSSISTILKPHQLNSYSTPQPHLNITFVIALSSCAIYFPGVSQRKWKLKPLDGATRGGASIDIQTQFSSAEDHQGPQWNLIPLFKEVVDVSKQRCQFNAALIFSIHSLSDVTVCVKFMCSVFPFFSSHFVCSFSTLILYLPLSSISTILKPHNQLNSYSTPQPHLNITLRFKLSSFYLTQLTILSILQSPHFMSLILSAQLFSSIIPPKLSVTTVGYLSYVVYFLMFLPQCASQLNTYVKNGPLALAVHQMMPRTFDDTTQTNCQAFNSPHVQLAGSRGWVTQSLHSLWFMMSCSNVKGVGKRNPSGQGEHQIWTVHTLIFFACSIPLPKDLGKFCKKKVKKRNIKKTKVQNKIKKLSFQPGSRLGPMYCRPKIISIWLERR
ncbi:hypothetical protein VP01_2389g2 [Puccinia sorghi]|uniref:Uncharacterized protein n=1 Tax=Puccinia sorghi TaxID=27349 RepID=A0A0L6V8R8_9BASI|nr:hypothetical protein VP01_2389g2 [Puccinia sorghi]